MASCVLFVAAILGCNEWNPERDNPLDPSNYRYQHATGDLNLRVVTLGTPPQPIANATVLLSDHGRFALTNAEGRVTIPDIPPGPTWVTAYRSEGDSVYLRDSIQVTIAISNVSDTTLKLDGLPQFVQVSASAVSYVESAQQENPYYSANLKATVNDPDGVADLRRVSATWIDPSTFDTIQARLAFQPDSGFWAVTIPSDSFPNKRLERVMTLPFKFQAIDNLGNQSPPATAAIAFVFHRTPDTHVIAEAEPLIYWNYLFNTELFDTSLFYYLVRVYRDPVAPQMIYQRVVPSRNSTYNEHRMESTLITFDYLAEVWVVDLHGNRARSARALFRIP